MLTLIFFALPISLVAYTLIAYLWFKCKYRDNGSFTKDFWYTKKNIFHNSYALHFAVVLYMLLVVVMGLLEGLEID